LYFLEIVQKKKKTRSKILDKLVLGCIRYLGLGLVAGWGSKRVEKGRKGQFFFFQHQPGKNKLSLKKKLRLTN
jgi:hypothetical protein